MAINVRNEGAKVNSNINVTPMVDVMLVLLIIFMVITPMLQKGQSVDLAKANNPTPMTDADKEDAVIVAVMRDGQVFLDTQKVTPEELTQKVKDRISTRTKKQVFVKADARAKYKGVVEVVDDVRSAGVDEVGLLTEQRQNPNKPAPQ
jgi:biopolymer transport protein ExbD/biopolymer transport protein TolR